MEKIRYWGADIVGCMTSFACWFTPRHCEHIAQIIAVIIGIITLLFITLPKAWPNIKKVLRRGGKK